MNKAAFLAYYGGRRRNTGFTPASLTQVVAWWSADDHGAANMTDDGAGLISAWKDRIGGLSLTGATTARPTWGATAFNSAKAGVTFDGVVNTLRGTTLTGLPVAATAGFILAASDPGISAAATKFVFQYGNSTNGQNRQVRRQNNANSDKARAGDGGATLFSDSPGGWVAPGLIEGSFDSTVTSYLNGTASVVSASGTLNTNTTRIAMGADVATSAGNFSLVINRHVMVTTALTTLQRQQLEGWLAWDCGIQSVLPSGHPYRLGPP